MHTGRKYKIITISGIILTVSIISLATVYFIEDKQLFYYGKSDFNIYSLLPHNIQPEYRPDFEGGFALKDEHGFSIAAKNNTYRFNNDTIRINEVIGYYFNREKLIALINSEHDENYYIEFAENTNAHTPKDFNVSVWKEDRNFDRSAFTWISINDKQVKKLELIRNCSGFIIIFLILYLIIRVVVVRSQ